MTEFELRVNESELNLLLNSLAQLPYVKVNELMQKLADQIGPQIPANGSAADQPPRNEMI